MIVQPALNQALRTLKLSGMLETLEARLAQARAGELGHIEFLQVLCHDEISRRDSHAVTRRIRRAQFEQQATLEGFDFAASPKLPAGQIRDLAALHWLAAGESVILYGPVGVGKSHVAQALGHLAIRHGADVRFTKASRVLATLAGGHADHSWDKRLAELTRPAVLILDDFAIRELTAAQADDLYELVTLRADAGRNLVLTSNRSPVDWYPLFPNPVVAGAARPADQHQPPGHDGGNANGLCWTLTAGRWSSDPVCSGGCRQGRAGRAGCVVGSGRVSR
jgi:DNA replication protein DnaC